MNFINKIAKFLGYEKTRVVGISHFVEEQQITPVEQPPETPPDISEPIIKIVELMKSNPKRFRVSQTIAIPHSGRSHYFITDKLARLTIEVFADYFQGDTVIFSNTDWVTKDEANILYKAAQGLIENQNERIKRVREWQRNRKRSKWVKVYCGENN